MKKKKIINLISLLTLTLFLNACIINLPVINSFVSSSQINSSGTFDGEWSNEEAVIASMYIDTSINDFNVLVDNIDNYFNNLHYKKLYIMQKYIDYPYASSLQGYLELLFILKEGGEEKQKEFIEQLLLNDMVAYAHKCYDVPHETIDTRALDITQATINIGEELTINYSGYFSKYYPAFDFSSIQVILTNFNDSKTYTVDDFPQVNLKSVERDDWNLVLELTESNYFNFIKSCNILARNSNINTLSCFNIDYPDVELRHLIWEVLDDTIIKIVGDYDNSSVTIKGINNGTTTIWYNYLSCEITVV